MKTIKQARRLLKVHLKFKSLAFFVMLFTISFGCSKDNDPVALATGNISGSVKGINGNPFPNTGVILNGASTTNTNSQGNFSISNKNIGSYSLSIKRPLSTLVDTQNPMTINVQENQTSITDFIIQPIPIEAIINIGNFDVFGEVRNVNGDIPTNTSEALYKRNVFDPPLGQLTAIEDPDNNPITLAEWMTANGTVTVNCDGNTSSISITLEGLIPNGTYSFWLNFLSSPKQPGNPVSLEDIDSIEPLESGSLNVAIADANGIINISRTHASCILTKKPGLVMPILYHINGNTYGSAHIPDTEYATHLLVYFQ